MKVFDDDLVEDDHHRRSLPPLVQETVARVVGCLRSSTQLAWLYGQGSVINGFSTDSDLDFVAVWHQLPTSSALPGKIGLTEYSGLALEHTGLDGFDVDIQHVPLETFQGWLSEVHAGNGWQGDEWPLPVHVAAGLSSGWLLIDPDGLGARARTATRTPTNALSDTVRRRLVESAPAYVEQLSRSDTQGDFWLFDLLAVRFHRLIYTAWFVLEGHHPPFPKHLEQWADRLDLDLSVRTTERRVWTENERPRRVEALAALAAAVLALRPLSSE